MGELILCSHSIAAMPYYIDSVSLNIYSLEELCYHMEEHLYLIEPDFMNEDLCSWIERELGDRKLASALRNVLHDEKGSLADFVEMILRSCDYCSEKSIQHILTVLGEMQSKSAFECTKIRADRFMENEKYVKAISEYRVALEMKEECIKNPVLEGNIRHNLGTAYARLFLFDEAAACFMAAFRLNQNRESMIECLAACRLAKKNDILNKYKEEFEMPDEDFRELMDQWNTILNGDETRRLQAETEQLIKDASLQAEQNTKLEEQIQTWTIEYKKSCRI